MPGRREEPRDVNREGRLPRSSHRDVSRITTGTASGGRERDRGRRGGSGTGRRRSREPTRAEAPSDRLPLGAFMRRSLPSRRCVRTSRTVSRPPPRSLDHPARSRTGVPPQRRVGGSVRNRSDSWDAFLDLGTPLRPPAAVWRRPEVLDVRAEDGRPRPRPRVDMFAPRRAPGSPTKATAAWPVEREQLPELSSRTTRAFAVGHEAGAGADPTGGPSDASRGAASLRRRQGSLSREHPRDRSKRSGLRGAITRTRAPSAAREAAEGLEEALPPLPPRCSRRSRADRRSRDPGRSTRKRPSEGDVDRGELEVFPVTRIRSGGTPSSTKRSRSRVDCRSTKRTWRRARERRGATRRTGGTPRWTACRHDQAPGPA